MALSWATIRHLSPVQLLVLANLAIFIIFTAVYLILNINLPGAFYSSVDPSTSHSPHEKLKSRDIIYFSIITHTTVGYGDITPWHWASKLLVCIQTLLVWITGLGFVWWSVQKLGKTLGDRVIQEISRSRMHA